MLISSKRPFILGLLLITMLAGCERTNQETPSEVKTATAKTPTPAVVPPANLSAKVPGVQVSPTSTAAAPPLLTQPSQAEFVEMPSDALPIWRQYRDQHPTLVIFSSDPMLMVIDPRVSEQVAALVEHGKPEAFLRHGRVQVVDPLILPEQTLTAALNSRFFSRIVWVLPPPAPDKEISPEAFRLKLRQNGILTEAESAELTYANGLYQGTLQGLPFMATATGPLPPLDGPVILHFDFSFFTEQYRNEITTPIFTLLQGTLVALRQTGWQTLAATFAIMTEEGKFPLELRFIKNLLAEVFAKPKLLDEELPEIWALRKEAMHAEMFFQAETIADHYLHMEELRPKDASAKYDVYRTLIMLKDREAALFYLDQAIALDKGYAFEYLKLANTAMTKSRLAEALAHLKKAQKLLPQNPFVRMETASIMLRLGMRKEAGALVQELQALPWSAVYYPNIDTALKELEEAARNEPVK